MSSLQKVGEWFEYYYADEADKVIAQRDATIAALSAELAKSNEAGLTMLHEADRIKREAERLSAELEAVRKTLELEQSHRQQEFKAGHAEAGELRRELEAARVALFAYHDYVNGPDGEWSAVGQRAKRLVEEQRKAALPVQARGETK